MSLRRDILRGYFLEVTRDLVARGVMRRARGQSLEDILRLEAPAILREVQADFLEIGIEVGGGLLSAGARVAETVARVQADRIVGEGARMISEAFASILTGKRR